MSNSNNNQINIPQAREAMDRFKMQAAQEVGVNLTNGYNGHLTSREAGSVGGQMVKKMCPARSVKFERQNRTAAGHTQNVQYIAAITLSCSALQNTFPSKSQLAKNDPSG